MKMTKENLKELDIKNYEGSLPCERETHISHSEDMGGFFAIDTGETKVIEYLLNNDNFDLFRYYLSADQKAVTYVDGILPLSCLRLKKNANNAYNQLWYILKN